MSQTSLTLESIFPFKDHFQKKFMGNQVQQFIILKKKLLKDPVDKKLKLIFGDNPQLQSKIIQLEKINNSQKKEALSLPKKRQILTPLQIYMSKKQLKKYQESNLFITTQSKPLMSDQQINQRFNQFLVAKKYGDVNNNLRNTFLFARSLSKQLKTQQIQKRKVELKQIVYKMLRQNKSPQENPQEMYSDNETQSQKGEKKVNKNINWILKQCNKYQRKYIIKCKKAKSTKKL